jgi:C-terminal processing protease CtpA/Prc
MILVDGDSASAAELFTAMLQDAKRARVVGSPTLGTGCGWTLPRAPVTLQHSGGQLFMPDCARLRADGSNELDGIQPQLLIGFRTYDSAAQRVRRFSAALPQALADNP